VLSLPTFLTFAFLWFVRDSCSFALWHAASFQLLVLFGVLTEPAFCGGVSTFSLLPGHYFWTFFTTRSASCLPFIIGLEAEDLPLAFCFGFEGLTGMLYLLTLEDTQEVQE